MGSGARWDNWPELAAEELRQSKEALAAGVYPPVVFTAHQVVEHALKALYMSRSDGLPRQPTTSWNCASLLRRRGTSCPSASSSRPST